MLGGFVKFPDHEIDKIVDRVLNDDRVERIARRITEMMLRQLQESLAVRDAQKDS